MRKAAPRIVALLPCRVQRRLGEARITFKQTAGETSEARARFTRVYERRYPACIEDRGGGAVNCPNCGADNRPDAKFCRECGSAIDVRCPTCGASNEPGQKFCDECGTALAGRPPVAPTTAAGSPAAERRLVSVLFADLVGFTTLSEGRDAEEVRELLSRYFESCQRLISLYGGTVEKFIGDAVMAVWGTPTAEEDDAERAVRAALDLVPMVSALGQEVGAPELRARAGVVTGSAAVTLGAVGEGMVAGDLVNTASRIQAAADAGSVLVGESTRRATEAAIAYGDAGVHELKGKAEPVRLFRALRVTAGRGGALKGGGLEPPFVGREREFRMVKDLFHASAEERKAHLVSVVGIAGIGKSRLSWEFEKYVDGLADDVWWHRGRCLAYGDGVAYWALAEMVRMRCRIAEDDEPTAAHEKLRATLAEHISDRTERQWVEPRLAHLLALEAAAPRGSGEPLLRVAHPVRAARRAVADSAGVRGHALGGRGAARLHRVPAGVVAQPPALRARAGAARVR
jgi:class 3 adenylate cyclase